MQSLGISLSRLIGKKGSVAQKCRQVGKSMFSKYLLVTNIGVSLSLSGAGDILEQVYEITSDKLESWDSVRTRNMATSGMVVGALCHYWYQFLDKKLPERSFKVVFKKVIVDQIVFSPFYIGAFLITMGMLEKSSSERIKQEVIQKGWRLYVAEWVIWPPAQVINFYFLPTRFRVLYDNTISLGYDIYTSYVKHDDEDD